MPPLSAMIKVKITAEVPVSRLQVSAYTMPTDAPEGKPPVLLWADTFNNYFHPEVARAAVEVLEHAGYQVWVPAASLCCGRPLYDFGMLDDAKKLLRRILLTLQPQIEAGIPVVGLEPSCLSVFRDEMINLFPNDGDARRLHEQAFTFSEFLNQKAWQQHTPRRRGHACRLPRGAEPHRGERLAPGRTHIPGAVGFVIGKNEATPFPPIPPIPAQARCRDQPVR
jgi:Fe-S oxidoreductase